MLAGRALIPALVVGLLLEASTAEADGPYGPELGLRASYALPFGDAVASPTETQALDEYVRNLIPFGVDLGYRFSGRLGFSVYADYATTAIDDLCDPTALECSATRLRAGIQGLVHLNPDTNIDPWIGLGVGYEMLTLTTVGQTADSEEALSGLEFVGAQAGLDFLSRSSPISFGPFARLSMGQYDTQDVTLDGVPIPTEPETTLHYWFEFGIRAAWVLDFRSDAEKNPPKPKALRRTSTGEADFDQPLGSSAGATAREPGGLGQSLSMSPEDQVLLGARRDLHYQGDKIESCECLAVAVGPAEDERFWWDCGPPLLNDRTQIAFAMSTEGVPCTSAPAGSLGASYAGYTRNGDDVIIEVEAVKPGYPIVEGAIIPRPNPGGAIFVRSKRGVVYGRPRGVSGNQCRVMTIRSP